MQVKSKRKALLEFINKLKYKLKSKLNFIEYEKNTSKSNLNFEKINSTQIQLKWKIDNYFQSILLNPRIYCLGLRIYDITSGNSKNDSTCIMKELEVNKQKSHYLYELPLDNGVFLIELGYRNTKDNWSIICSSTIDLGLRKKQEDFFDDSWFYKSKSKISMPKSLHEKLYRLSKSMRIGGSELIKK